MSTLALPLAFPNTAGSSSSSAQPSRRPSSLALPTVSSLSADRSAQNMGSGGNGGPSRDPAPLARDLPPRDRASHSPVKDDEEEEEDEDEEDEGVKKKGKKKKKESEGKEYKYSSEISQMMFVFGEVQDPLPETVRLVEDVVRGQIIEIVTRARLLTHLRSSRYLSAEDLIFLIRDDRGKVNRLRTYLSWKDVRKRAKDEEGGAEGDVDIDDAEKAAAKGRKSMVKLPWELLTPFSDFLKGLPSRQNRDEDEDEDEDEVQAYQDSMQRLRDADEITKKMTKDEYVHYSDCRQASFTYRKARRFREFVNFSAYLDVRPNDDIVDILGFLSFEMVRSLCVAALEVRDRLERTAPRPPLTGTGRRGTIVGRRDGAGATAGTAGAGSGASPSKRKSTLASSVPGAGATVGPDGSPNKRARVESPEDTAMGAVGDANAGAESTGREGIDGFSASASTSPQQPAQSQIKDGVIFNTSGINHNFSNAPSAQPPTATPSTSTSASTRRHAVYPISLFAPPPSARQPLLPAHVLEAFAQIQRKEAAGRGAGMRHFRGGVRGGRMALV